MTILLSVWLLVALTLVYPMAKYAVSGPHEPLSWRNVHLFGGVTFLAVVLAGLWPLILFAILRKQFLIAWLNR